jgi:hypothetical protein
MTAYLVRDGATLTGRVDSKMGSLPLIDGAAAGDDLSWAVDVSQPMPMKIAFTVKQEGESLTGAAKLGAFGDAALSGVRKA